MAYLPETYERVQFAIETTPGTLVSANYQFHSLLFDIDPVRPTTEARQAGNRFPVANIPGKGSEKSSAKGDVSVQDVIVAFATNLINPTFAQVGVLAYTATFFPGSFSPNTRKSLSIEKGQSALAFKFGYGTFTEWEIDFVPDKQVSFSGSLIGQKRTTGISLTNSPTILADSLLFPTQIDVFLATTEAGLAAGQIKPLSAKVKLSKAIGDVYVLSSAAADASFTELVETAPNLTAEIVLPKSAATDAWLAAIDTEQVYYLEIRARGAALETVSAVTYYNELKIRMPVQFTNPSEGMAQDVHTATFVLNAIHVDTFNTTGGALKITATSLLTALPA